MNNRFSSANLFCITLYLNISMEGYQNLRVLGEGTFGRCYLVSHRATKELSVIKQIDIRGLSDQEKINTRREACILEALDHPNIIKFIRTFDSKPGYMNIVMSYADGGDLSKKIKEAKGVHFPENIILGWFTQVCLAIKHIHERRFIHRDLKCENIFMTKENLIKLGDFGIARSLKQSLEKAKTVVGTPYYMSPEICDNKDYTAKTDIWSLGVVLYQICCLKPPFQSNSLTNLALKICKGEYPPVPSIYSKQLRRLIADLLTVEPKQRPSINQVMKSSIIQSRIQIYLNFAERQIQNQEQNITIEVPSTQSRKIQKIKPSISPKLADNAPLFVMLPTSPTNVIKEGKIKINDVKKGKMIPSGRKREISQPVHSPRNMAKESKEPLKKQVPSVIQKLERKKPVAEPKELKGKKIEEYHSSLSKKKLQEEHIEMSESFMFQQIPVQLLKDVISSERNLAYKQQEFQNSVSMIFQKYERESLELDFKQETQSETLEAMLIKRLGGKKFQTLLEIVKKGGGFPEEKLTQGLSPQELDLMPMVSLYYGGYVLNMM